jgi:hypothetical protein
MKKIILTISLLFLITSVYAESFTYLIPGKPAGGMAKWATIFAKEWSKELEKEGHSIILRHITGQRGRKGFVTWYKKHSKDNTVIVQTNGYNTFLMSKKWKGFDPRIHGQTIGGQLQGTFAFKKTNVTPGVDNVAIIMHPNAFVDAMGHILLMCGNNSLKISIKCAKSNTRWVSGFTTGEARKAFLVDELQVMRDGYFHANKTYKKQIKKGIAEIWYTHGTLDNDGNIIPDPNAKPDLWFDNKFKEKWNEPPAGKFYDAYSMLLKLRAGLGKTIFTKKDNPHYDMLVRTMQATVNNKSSKKVLDKRLGTYDWHFGTDSQNMVSFIWNNLSKPVYNDMFTVLKTFNKKVKKKKDLF